MQKKEFIILPKRKELKLYEEYGFNTFILPLKDYSIGFNVYFDIDEINKIAKCNAVYVIMNRLLHKQVYDFDISKFNDNIKFIVEDIGLLSFIPRERVVLYEHHILSNYKAVNYLNTLGIISVVINNIMQTIKASKSFVHKINYKMLINIVIHKVIHIIHRQLKWITSKNNNMIILHKI